MSKDQINPSERDPNRVGKEKAMYLCFSKHRAQAKFRGEPYELSFQEFSFLWNTRQPFSQITNWDTKTIPAISCYMTRRDISSSWNKSNITFSKSKSGILPKSKIK